MLVAGRTGLLTRVTGVPWTLDPAGQTASSTSCMAKYIGTVTVLFWSPGEFFLCRWNKLFNKFACLFPLVCKCLRYKSEKSSGNWNNCLLLHYFPPKILIDYGPLVTYLEYVLFKIVMTRLFKLYRTLYAREQLKSLTCVRQPSFIIKNRRQSWRMYLALIIMNVHKQSLFHFRSFHTCVRSNLEMLNIAVYIGK